MDPVVRDLRDAYKGPVVFSAEEIFREGLKGLFLIS